VFAECLEFVVDELIQKMIFHNSGSNTEHQAFLRFTEFVEISESVRPGLWNVAFKLIIGYFNQLLYYFYLS
jgi:hypothetical protein